jgi:[acyl-carrier-protein] S-malonyltransferase
MSEHENPVAWLFPGQGSQEIGMGARLLKGYPRANAILEMAEDLAQMNLRQYIQRGPIDQLTRTEVVQPAVTAISCGYVDLLFEAGHVPSFVAGHSLGELPALYAAGSLDLQDVLRLAVERGRMMSECAHGGMLAVNSCGLCLLEELIVQVRGGIACLANLNAPSQLVVSGDEAGLEELTTLIRRTGGDVVRLNVSGAWHSPLVAVAAYSFQKVLATARFEKPNYPVVMSSQAKVSTCQGEIRCAMLNQMTSTVRWYETVCRLAECQCTTYYEVGPGKVLKGLLRRILPQDSSYAVHGLEQGRLLSQLLRASTR